MESIGKIMSKKFSSSPIRNNVNNDNNYFSNNDINVNNDNNYFPNNDINVNNGGNKSSKYALDKSKFIPNTPETQLAQKIGEYFNDLNNYAFYLNVVNKLGVDRAYSFWQSVKREIEEKQNDEKFRIRLPANFFAWKYREGLTG